MKSLVFFHLYIYLLLGLDIMFIICHFMCLLYLYSTPTIVYWVFEVSFFIIYAIFVQFSI